MLIKKELSAIFFRFEDMIYESGHLDTKTKHLIALANTILVDCLPCFVYHYKKAIEKDATIGEIKEAIAVAIAVNGGNKFVKFTDIAHKLEKELKLEPSTLVDVW